MEGGRGSIIKAILIGSAFENGTKNETESQMERGEISKGTNKRFPLARKLGITEMTHHCSPVHLDPLYLYSNQTYRLLRASFTHSPQHTRHLKYVGKATECNENDWSHYLEKLSTNGFVVSIQRAENVKEICALTGFWDQSVRGKRSNLCPLLSQSTYWSSTFMGYSMVGSKAFYQVIYLTKIKGSQFYKRVVKFCLLCGWKRIFIAIYFKRFLFPDFVLRKVR